MLSVLDTINTTICGGIEVPDTLFNAVSTIIRLIKIVVPILLIIWGMLDFAKSVVAKKEDDIKAYRKAFINRLISALLVFLVITIVQLAVSLVSGVEKESHVEGQTVGDIWACSKKFINGVDASDKKIDVSKTEKIDE
ncbi:MAG: hypothetical protein IKE75_03025 [Bacilli bacterium]|nr:hypothetical protein [Bacilli bacterium]